jgi:hypothetical protein
MGHNVVSVGDFFPDFQTNVVSIFKGQVVIEEVPTPDNWK